jgi:hypothetical protein
MLKVVLRTRRRIEEAWRTQATERARESITKLLRGQISEERLMRTGYLRQCLKTGAAIGGYLGSRPIRSASRTALWTVVSTWCMGTQRTIPADRSTAGKLIWSRLRGSGRRLRGHLTSSPHKRESARQMVLQGSDPVCVYIDHGLIAGRPRVMRNPHPTV